MAAITSKWPQDARGHETTICHKEINENDLRRLRDIALQDMNRYFKQRPELEKLRFCVVLGESAAGHYLNKNGFRCISVWTFFRKTAGVRGIHPLRHPRVDFGSPKFGHSSWIKHPSDKGFKGRGVNCFGRSIAAPADKSMGEIMKDYLRNDRSKGAARLRESGIVVLWPPEDFGTVIRVKK